MSAIAYDVAEQRRAATRAHFALRDENQLCAAMPAEVKARFGAELKLVDLPRGDIYEPGSAVRYAYFPNSAIVSLLSVTENGKSVEVSVIGNEGVVGVAAFLGGGPAFSRAEVQSPGSAYRLPGQLLKEELEQNSELLQRFLHYTQSLIGQMSQIAVCNRHHTILQQLCRRLLTALDHMPGTRINLTQETLANNLGVRREGVTAAAGQLRDLGAIEYRRGHIKVLDRASLERISCECYASVRAANGAPAAREHLHS